MAATIKDTFKINSAIHNCFPTLSCIQRFKDEKIIITESVNLTLIYDLAKLFCVRSFTFTSLLPLSAPIVYDAAGDRLVAIKNRTQIDLIKADGDDVQTTKLDLSYSETFNQTHLADAYERLLLETMRGIQALFVRRDEVEEAWKWVDSITEAWAADQDAPKPYQAGTWGPVASVAMITRDGRSWNEFE